MSSRIRKSKKDSIFFGFLFVRNTQILVVMSCKLNIWLSHLQLVQGNYCINIIYNSCFLISNLLDAPTWEHWALLLYNNMNLGSFVCFIRGSHRKCAMTEGVTLPVRS